LSLLVVVALATALALPMFAAAVAEGALAAVERIDAKPTVSVFLVAQAGAKERESAERALRALPGVAAVRFVSRDAALAELAALEGWATSWPGSTATRSRTRWSPRYPTRIPELRPPSPVGSDRFPAWPMCNPTWRGSRASRRSPGRSGGSACCSAR
jgi:hypothetical protein